MSAKDNHKAWLANLMIAVISGLFFIPFLGGVHLFDWDEINFAESAREMLVSGDYLTVRINYVLHSGRNLPCLYVCRYSQ
jgi:4-amino-4-deoxy-L-arabinose transferase-like glycosyltransferase